MISILSHDQIALVKKTLQEDEERFDHLLGLLENWINWHNFIPRNCNKKMLPIFLRNCKYDLNKTKLKLELYFVHKKRYPEAFCFYEFNDTERKALDNFYVFESSNLTPRGYRVSCVGFRSPATTECDMNVVNKLMAMFATYRANCDEINGGMVLVVNLQNVSPSILSSIINPFFKRLLGMVQKIYPSRVCGVYVTFLPEFAASIANMIKWVFSEKIRNRIIMETGNEQMKKSIPLNCLPKEFGGTDGTINENAAKCVHHMEMLKDWFQEQEKVQIVGDIPQDLYEISGIDENFGTPGSFRTLDID